MASKERIFTKDSSLGFGMAVVLDNAHQTEARNITGDVLHVDGGAHPGQW
jgi:hypothetical protein